MTSPILKKSYELQFLFLFLLENPTIFRLFVRICKKIPYKFVPQLFTFCRDLCIIGASLRKKVLLMQTQKFYQRSGFWFCCTLLWCVVIFCFSAQDATQSNAVSNGVLHKIAEICTAWIPADAMDLESSTHTSMAFFIRKIAHFTLYFILGLLSCATMMTYCQKKNRSLSAGWFCAWAFCIFYATTDEFHQLFVPGRTGRLLDIGIDSCGALLGSLILLFFVYRAAQRCQKPEKGV